MISQPKHIPIKRKDLQPFSEGEGRKLLNQFEEILRHNNISDKSNAFNRILSLILCKIVDEQKKDYEITDFQIIEGKDTPEAIQERLQELYAKGMKRFLKEEIINYSQKDIDYWVNNFPDQVAQKEIRKILRELKFYSNNEFAFKEVHNENLFLENAKVLNEIIMILQYKQFRYYYKDGNGFKHQKQYLGNFFELLLDAGYKQSEGQFFTPLPIAEFIVKSIPFREIVKQKLLSDTTDFLPYLIDFACGSGHFLTEAIEELQHIIDEIEPRYSDEINRKLCCFKHSTDWAEKFVYGIEKDYRLARTAKVACFMNGDGQANIFFGDGLEDYHEENRNLVPSYDVLIANPPYSIHGFKPHALNLKDKYSLFQYLTDNSSEIEALFVERMTQLLHTDGMTGIILPSSILNNSGIYMRAREIILQNFIIKGIVELGSAAFMATGTNTIVLFMQKRDPRWKEDFRFVADDYILKNKKRADDFTDTEVLLKNYAEFIGSDIEDYKTFTARNDNDSVKSAEWHKDYQNWFDNQPDTKKLKKELQKKKYENLSEDAKQQKIEQLFYDNVLKIESAKFYYYLLTHDQEIVIVKAGNDLSASRKFLGYEFKKGRQAGIVMNYDKAGRHNTALYDENHLLNPEKANYYIYQKFINQKTDIPEFLKEHISKADLIDCMDFKRVEFEKQINLSASKKMKSVSKHNSIMLQNCIETLESGSRPKGGVGNIESGIPSLGGEHIGLNGRIVLENMKFVDEDFFNNAEKGHIRSNDILLCKDGALTGKIAFVDKDFPYGKAMINEHVFIIRSRKDIMNQKFLFIFLFSQMGQQLLKSEITGQAQGGLNSLNLLSIQIPCPPMEIQKKIVKEIEDLEAREKETAFMITEHKQKIERLFSGCSKVTIKSVCRISSKKWEPNKELEKEFNYIGLEDIERNNGKLVQNWQPTIGANLKSTKNFFQKGDVLYGKLRPYLNKVLVTEFSGVCSTDILVLKTSYPFLLKHSLMTRDFTEKASGLMKGINLPRISPKDFSESDIFYPDEDKQQDIEGKIKSIENRIAEIESELKQILNRKAEILKKIL